jgi:ParB family chromosome partitioning protein
VAKQAIEGATRGNIFNIEPERLELITNTTHPLYDPRVNNPLNEMFVEAMVQHGWVGGVIAVRKNGDKIEVEDGRQRVKTVIEANKRRAKLKLEPIFVPVQPTRDDDNEAFVAMVMLNGFRTEDAPSVKAEKIHRYMKLNHSEEEAAVVFGMSVSSVKNHLRLRDTSATIRKAVDTGKISANEARKVAELPREEQDKALAAAEEKGTSVRTEAHARGAKQKVVREGASRKDVRKVLEAYRKDDLKISAETVTVLRWFAGEIGERGLGETCPEILEALRAEKKNAKKAA